MAELGRKGGCGRTRSVLGIREQVADESLREKARKRLERVLEGDDEAAALRAATGCGRCPSALPGPMHCPLLRTWRRWWRRSRLLPASVEPRLLAYCARCPA
jgi:hypothetical protein